MSDLTFAIFLLLALGIGFAAGWSSAVLLRRDRKKLQALEEALEQARARVLEKTRELEDYRGQVNRHFEKTAELFHGLTEQYREVYLHLARSAQQLIGEQPPALRADIQTAERLAQPAGAAATATGTETEASSPTAETQEEKDSPEPPVRPRGTDTDEEDVFGDAPHVPELRRQKKPEAATEESGGQARENVSSPAP